MARLSFTKGALSREREQLRLYRKLLPSLDLKRRQLTAAREAESRELEKLRQAVPQLRDRVSRTVPMLANTEVALQHLVRVAAVETSGRNVVGTRLLLLEDVRFDVAHYSFITKPAWVDVVVERLQEALRLALEVQLAERRVDTLERAVRRATQRVNLFERVLIPRSERNIARIAIVLGDRERDAVVRAKLAKRKRSAESSTQESEAAE